MECGKKGLGLPSIEEGLWFLSAPLGRVMVRMMALASIFAKTEVYSSNAPCDFWEIPWNIGGMDLKFGTK